MKNINEFKEQSESLSGSLTKRKATARKKAEKSWVLQRMWNTIDDFEKYSHGFNPHPVIGEWENTIHKFITPKQAQNQMNKQLRTHFHPRFRNGRSWRLFNTVTLKSLKVEFDSESVIIEEELTPVLT
jgi:hypothetical protein